MILPLMFALITKLKPQAHLWGDILIQSFQEFKNSTHLYEN